MPAPVRARQAAGGRRRSAVAPEAARTTAGVGASLKLAAWLALILGTVFFVLLRWLGDRPPAQPLFSLGRPSASIAPWLPSLRVEDAPERTGREGAGARPTLGLRGPDVIRGGEELAVDCLVHVPAGARGWIDVAFDPALLTLADASTRYEPRGPGQVRLMLAGWPGPSAVVTLQFATAFSAPGPTIVRISGGEIVTAEGRPAGLGSLPALSVVIRAA